MVVCEVVSLCAACTIIGSCFFIVTDITREFDKQGMCRNVSDLKIPGYDTADTHKIFHPDICTLTRKQFEAGVYTKLIPEWDQQPKIKNEILHNYHKNKSPGSLVNSSTVVGFQLKVLEFHVDETTEPILHVFGLLYLGWKDSRLSWKYFDQIEENVIRHFDDDWKFRDNILFYWKDEIWWPYIQVLGQNSLNLKNHYIVRTSSNIIGAYQNGLTRLETKVKITSPCQLDLKLWPFHSYSCDFKLNLTTNQNDGVIDWTPLEKNFGLLERSSSKTPKTKKQTTTYLITESMIRDENWKALTWEARRSWSETGSCRYCKEPFLTFRFPVRRYAPLFTAFVTFSHLATICLTISALILKASKYNKIKIRIASVTTVLVVTLLIVFGYEMPLSDGGVPIFFRLYHWTLTNLLVSLITSLLYLCSIQTTFSFLQFNFPERFSPIISNGKLFRVLHLNHLLPVDIGDGNRQANENATGIELKGRRHREPTNVRRNTDLQLADSDEEPVFVRQLPRSQSRSIEPKPEAPNELLPELIVEDSNVVDIDLDNDIGNQNQNQNQNVVNQENDEDNHDSAPLVVNNNSKWLLLTSLLDRITLILYTTVSFLIILTYVVSIIRR